MQGLLSEIKNCSVCKDLPLGPRPVVQFNALSKIAIIGQAPGTKVHASGIPWDDQSGKRLRGWLAVSDEEFYNVNNFAIVPMGFCYPGKGKSGDLPPKKECAPLWHFKIWQESKDIELWILIGQYAQSYYLKDRERNLTETVRHFENYGPKMIPLPHPSPRNQLWLKKNPWFEKDVLPYLRNRVKMLL